MQNAKLHATLTSVFRLQIWSYRLLLLFDWIVREMRNCDRLIVATPWLLSNSFSEFNLFSRFIWRVSNCSSVILLSSAHFAVVKSVSVLGRLELCCRVTVWVTFTTDSNPFPGEDVKRDVFEFYPFILPAELVALPEVCVTFHPLVISVSSSHTVMCTSVEMHQSKFWSKQTTNLFYVISLSR